MHPGLKKSRRIAVAVALALAGSAAQADITTTISGFGTVGGSFTSSDEFGYNHDATEFTSATKQFDVGLESRLGVQARFDVGPEFSITAQELLRERGSTQFDPGLEWLYAQWAPTSDLQLRVGRVVLPVFMYSDSRQVGFASPWFRAPNEVYRAFPFDYIDGGQVSWQTHIGSFGLALQGTVGNTSADFQLATGLLPIAAKNVYNGSVSLTWGDLLLRVADTHITVPNNLQLSATVTIPYLEQQHFATAGIQYDNGKAVFITEYATALPNDIPAFKEPLSKGWDYYVLGGWRFGKLLPTVTYGSTHVLQSLLSAPYSRASWSGTLRYDLFSNVALKAEVTRADASNQTWFNNVGTGPATGGQNVYSIGADFVF